MCMFGTKISYEFWMQFVCSERLSTCHREESKSNSIYTLSNRHSDFCIYYFI